MQRELGLDRGHEIVRNDVRERIFDALEHCETIAHATHHARHRYSEGLGHSGEDLARDLFLAALDLTEVTKGNARTARDLTKRLALLLSVIPKHVADLLTNQNHDGPSPSLLAFVDVVCSALERRAESYQRSRDSWVVDVLSRAITWEKRSAHILLFPRIRECLQRERDDALDRSAADLIARTGIDMSTPPVALWRDDAEVHKAYGLAIR